MTDRERLLAAFDKINAIVRDEIAPVLEATPELKNFGRRYDRSAYGWFLSGLSILRSTLDPSGTLRNSEIERLDEALARRAR